MPGISGASAPSPAAFPTAPTAPAIRGRDLEGNDVGKLHTPERNERKEGPLGYAVQAEVGRSHGAAGRRPAGGTTPIQGDNGSGDRTDEGRVEARSGIEGRCGQVDIQRTMGRGDDRSAQCSTRRYRDEKAGRSPGSLALIMRKYRSESREPAMRFGSDRSLFIRKRGFLFGAFDAFLITNRI